MNRSNLMNFGYLLELNGIRAGYFTKVSGLGLTVETVEYREGGDPATVRKLPGRTSIPDDASLSGE